MLYMHSYTYRGQPLARAARKCREFGYDGLELVISHYDRSRAAESIEEASEIARSAGSQLAVVDFSGNLIGEDAGDRERAEQGIAEVIRTAARLGAVGVNGSVGPLVGPDSNNWSENGSRIATDIHYERAAEALRRLGETASSVGIWLSLEIHMNTPHDTAASTRRLLDLVDHPSVVANLDPGNMYAVADAEPMPEAVAVLGSRLGYVHLKNCRELGGSFDYSWPLESGDIDLFRGLRAVVSSGYSGDYCIEYCGKGDPSVPARRDIVYFYETLEEAREQ